MDSLGAELSAFALILGRITCTAVPLVCTILPSKLTTCMFHAGITAKPLFNGGMHHPFLLSWWRADDRQTSDYLSKHLGQTIQYLSEHKCKAVCVVADNGSNMQAAIADIGSVLPLNCLGHCGMKFPISSPLIRFFTQLNYYKRMFMASGRTSSTRPAPLKVCSTDTTGRDASTWRKRRGWEEQCCATPVKPGGAPGQECLKAS